MFFAAERMLGSRAEELAGVLPCAEHAVSEEPHSMTVSLTGSCFQPRLFCCRNTGGRKNPVHTI